MNQPCHFDRWLFEIPDSAAQSAHLLTWTWPNKWKNQTCVKPGKRFWQLLKRNSSHRTRSTLQHVHANYGTHCSKWECPHGLQATSKGLYANLHANLLTRPVWMGPKALSSLSVLSIWLTSADLKVETKHRERTFLGHAGFLTTGSSWQQECFVHFQQRNANLEPRAKITILCPGLLNEAATKGGESMAVWAN